MSEGCRTLARAYDADPVKCHDGTQPKCPSLKGAPEGRACKSFNALVKHVAYSSWGAPNDNYEPLTEPLRFGAPGHPFDKDKQRDLCKTR